MSEDPVTPEEIANFIIYSRDDTFWLVHNTSMHKGITRRIVLISLPSQEGARPSRCGC